MPRPPNAFDSMVAKINDVRGSNIAPLPAPAVVAGAITSLAGLGATVYLLAKARWGMAALAFFIGGPAAAITVALAVAALTKKRT